MGEDGGLAAWAERSVRRRPGGLQAHDRLELRTQRSALALSVGPRVRHQASQRSASSRDISGPQAATNQAERATSIPHRRPLRPGTLQDREQHSPGSVQKLTALRRHARARRQYPPHPALSPWQPPHKANLTALTWPQEP